MPRPEAALELPLELPLDELDELDELPVLLELPEDLPPPDPLLLFLLRDFAPAPDPRPRDREPDEPVVPADEAGPAEPLPEADAAGLS